MKELPDKLWEMLILGIEAAKSVDLSVYKLDMTVWHQRQSSHNDKCLVCLAGAVMTQLPESNPTLTLEPYDFGESIQKKLRALNYLRSGDTYNALATLGRYDEYRKLHHNNSPHEKLQTACYCSREAPWVNDWEVHLAYAEELKRLNL